MNYEERVNEITTYRNAENGEFKFIRKGIVGSHKNEMSAELIRKFDKWIEKSLEGVDFAFEN